MLHVWLMLRSTSTDLPQRFHSNNTSVVSTTCITLLLLLFTEMVFMFAIFHINGVLEIPDSTILQALILMTLSILFMSRKFQLFYRTAGFRCMMSGYFEISTVILTCLLVCCLNNLSYTGHVDLKRITLSCVLKKTLS